MPENPIQLAVTRADYDRIWDFSQPEATEAELRSLLPAASQLQGREQCYHIELLTQIARSQGLQKKISEARTTLEEAERLLESHVEVCQVSAKIRWLLERGRLLVLERTPAQAHAMFREAWVLASNSGEDYLAVDSAQMLALTEPPKEQKNWLLKAVKLAEVSPQVKTKYWLGALYTSLGWKYYDLRQYDNALEIFQKALSHLNIEGKERPVFVAKWSLGKVLRAMSRIEEALTIQESLLAELRSHGARDGRVFEELAECLQLLKRSSEAQPYYGLAYEELSKDEWLKDNKPDHIKRLKDLGKVK